MTTGWPTEATTRSIRWSPCRSRRRPRRPSCSHTNLFILAYRNPFLAAKGIATLDVLSGGRMIVGLGAGYLEPEFEALGVPFADRNDRMDEAIAAMQAAWTGESVTLEGAAFRAPGNTMLPRPSNDRGHRCGSAVTAAGPCGGRSSRSTGGARSPTRHDVAARTRTAPLESAADLAGALEYAREHAEAVGRTEPLTVCFIPEGLSMGGRPVDEARVVDSIGELAAVDVDWVTVALAG